MTTDQPTESVPKTREELDAELSRFLRAAHRTRWALVTTVIIALFLAIGVLSWVIFQQARRLEASCQFYHDIAVAPLPVSPPKGRQPSALGTGIVLHARYTYQGQGCPGELPPPSAGLVKWSKFYHLPVPH